MKKFILVLLLSTSTLFGATHSFIVENDALASKDDSYYTGGLFYTTMEDEGERFDYFDFMNDLKHHSAISFTHLTFTPDNKKQTTPILNDIPYAGYAKLNFLIYKSSPNYFHEFGFNLGMVGPSTQADSLQSSFHNIIGQNEAKGWDTQLKDQFTSGISYQFAYKTDSYALGDFYFDWTNNLRMDAGNFYSGILASTTFRISSIPLESFATTGNFTVNDESNLLNFKKLKDFHWAISFGLFANEVSNYYIIDKARDLGYTIDKINYITGEQVSYDIFYNEIKYSFTIKSVYLNNRPFSSANKQWGGLSITWQF